MLKKCSRFTNQKPNFISSIAEQTKCATKEKKTSLTDKHSASLNEFESSYFIAISQIP